MKIDYEKVAEAVVKTVLDSIQECYMTIIIASGRKIIEVWAVTLILFFISLLCKWSGLPCCIRWDSALIAVGIMSAVMVLDHVNKEGISKIKEAVMKKGVEINERKKRIINSTEPFRKIKIHVKGGSKGSARQGNSKNSK